MVAVDAFNFAISIVAVQDAIIIKFNDIGVRFDINACLQNLSKSRHFTVVEFYGVNPIYL